MTRRIVTFALMALSGCVIPLAPDFEPEQNQPPFLVSVTPAIGSVTVNTMNPTFEAIVEDPNRTDDLYIRWLIDYPPFNQNVTRTIESTAASPGPGQPNQHPLRQQINCTNPGLSPALTSHRVTLVVSDRPFDDGTPDAGGDVRLDKIATDGFGVWSFWSFELACPLGP